MKKRYYVYRLIDPRNNKTFYIGKGSGRRINDHELPSNLKKLHPKNLLIKEIMDSGLSVIKLIEKADLTENQAFKLEAKLIKLIGRQNLTNRTDGGAGVPSWIVSDEDLAKDKSFVEIVLKLMRNTFCFSQPISFYFCGNLVQMEMDKCNNLYNSLKIKTNELIQKRGVEWINKISEPFNMEFTLSKIDGFR